MELLFPFFLTFLASSLLTKLIVSLRGEMRWLLRTPSEDRWHRTSTPSFGGIAMFLAFGTFVLIFARPLSGDTLKILGGGTLIFLLGLADDLFTLPPYTKLAGQIAVACLMVVLGIHAFLTWNPLIYIPLTLLWIVGITNAFNLLDNMDGLAGGIALISALFMGILSQMTEGTLLTPLIPIFIGAVGGFLWLNRSPAKIFMGDCGSQWLGFMLACLAILDTWRNVSNLFLMIATPVLVLAIPIFDTTLVALDRKIHGQSVAKGGKDHTSHRLVALGLNERQTVSILLGLSVVFGLVAVFAHLYNIEEWVLVAGGVVIFALVFGIFLIDAKVYQKTAKSAAEPLRIFRMNILYKRRIVEIIIDTILIGGSYTLAYLLRYDWKLGPYLLDQLGRTLPLIIGTKLTALLVFGLYRGLWTYIDFEGFTRLLRFSFLASAASILAILGLYRFEGFSRTLFAIDFVVLLLLMGGTRGLLRALRESVFAFPENGVRLLIVGAGDACRHLLDEIRRNRHWNFRPVAIVDDDRRKWRKKILGIPILGNCGDILRIVREKSIDKIVIAIPSAKEEDLRAIEKNCNASGVPFTAMQSLEATLIRQIANNG